MGQVKTRMILRNAREVVLAHLGQLALSQVHRVRVEARIDPHMPPCILPPAIADQHGLLRMAGPGDWTWPEGTEPVSIALCGRETVVSAVIGGREVCLGLDVLHGLGLRLDDSGGVVPLRSAWLVPGSLAGREA